MGTIDTVGLLGNPVVYLDNMIRAVFVVSAIKLGKPELPLPPTVTVVSPPANTQILADEALILDVLVPDTSSVLSVQIEARPGTSNLVVETVFSGSTFDATGFSPPYRTFSTVTAVSGGYRFTVIRDTGWQPDGPQLTVRGFDASGQVTPLTASWLYTVQTQTGGGTVPGISVTRSVDARLLDVVFSETVVAAEALVASNYTISPQLQVLGVQKISDTQYRLQTSKQTELQVYTVTCQNVHDLAGNLIA